MASVFACVGMSHKEAQKAQKIFAEFICRSRLTGAAALDYNP